jgi:hypothetical protein
MACNCWTQLNPNINIVFIRIVGINPSGTQQSTYSQIGQ